MLVALLGALAAPAASSTADLASVEVRSVVADLVRDAGTADAAGGG